MMEILEKNRGEKKQAKIKGKGTVKYKKQGHDNSASSNNDDGDHEHDDDDDVVDDKGDSDDDNDSKSGDTSDSEDDFPSNKQRKFSGKSDPSFLRITGHGNDRVKSSSTLPKHTTLDSDHEEKRRSRSFKDNKRKKNRKQRRLAERKLRQATAKQPITIEIPDD